MSVVKESVHSIQQTNQAIVLYNRLVELAKQINMINVGTPTFGVAGVDDLVCSSFEEFAVLKGFRNRTASKKREKMLKYHDKIYNSTFFEE